jgi:exosortase A-associated hydrolase 1
MGTPVRRLLTFSCTGAELHATLDPGEHPTGLLIVSGGNEIRIGAHRGMARLAQDLSAAGFPVFRFDRRGIGDSEGENGGFESSRPDIEAALDAFRRACPHLQQVIGFGNCDAASALVLHAIAGLDGLVIANPWAFEREAGLPPPAAVKDHYRRQLLSLAGWRKLLTGDISFRKLRGGVTSLMSRTVETSLLTRLAARLDSLAIPVTLVIATRDATGLAFYDSFSRSPLFAAARRKIQTTLIDSASHSFAAERDYQALRAAVLTALHQAGNQPRA